MTTRCVARLTAQVVMDSPRRAGLKDVAAQTHTSMVTSAWARSGTEGVAEAIRIRSIDAASVLNDRSILRAGGLCQRFSRSIGLILTNQMNAYRIALAEAVARQTAAHGLRLRLSSARNEPQTIKEDPLTWKIHCCRSTGR